MEADRGRPRRLVEKRIVPAFSAVLDTRVSRYLISSEGITEPSLGARSLPSKVHPADAAKVRLLVQAAPVTRAWLTDTIAGAPRAEARAGARCGRGRGRLREQNTEHIARSGKTAGNQARIAATGRRPSKQL